MITDKETGMRMLTTAEYAERYHYRPKSVAYWCKTGKLQGVVKETSKTRGFAGFRYMIPEKQALETPKRDYVRTAPKKMAPPTPKVVLKSNREKMKHILKYCGVKTYKQLSMDTGWPVMEVRRVYDELHEALGV